MIKIRWLLAIVLAWPLVVTGNVTNETVTISFERISLAALIDLVYSEILSESYVIHSEILSKTDEITVRLKSNFRKSDLNSFMAELLGGYSISIERNAQSKHIFFRPLSNSLKTKKTTFFYQPKYRDTSYLLSMLSPVFGDASFSNKRAVDVSQSSNGTDSKQTKDSQSSHSDNPTDAVLFTGTVEEIERLSSLLAEIDIPAKQVHIKAFIYQVSHTENDSTAIYLALNLLKGQIGLTLGALRTAGQALTVDTDELDFIFNIFNNDTRFKVISSPSLFVRSGETAKLSVGTETPVLGAITYPGNSSDPVQSVEYRNSGVLFNVKPKVYRDRIDLNIFQQISDFVPTNNGVTSSPTLIKRDVSSDFSLKNGQLVIIGGLKDYKGNEDKTYFPFTKFAMGDESTTIRSELLLFLYCEIVQDENLNISMPVPLNDFLFSPPEN
jgi:type II secretory pathway component GspD/PulD (secretin)